MADVFLSYKNTEERRRIVTRFATILRAHGISVWWDYGLEAGESYAEQIAAALDQAKMVIPFWCEESVKSEWVQQEAARGEDKLFPARLQRISPPPRFEMLHAAHLEHWNGSILDPTVDEFVRDICRKLGKPVELAPDTRAELASLPPITPLGPVGAVAEEESAKAVLTDLEQKVGSARKNAVWFLSFSLIVAAGIAAYAFLIEPWLEDRRTAEWADEHFSGPRPGESSAAGWSAPNDPLLPVQWYLGPSDEGGAGILEFRAATGADGSGITIAHFDTGVLERHADFLRSPSLVDGYDFISDPEMANDGDGRDTDPTDPGDSCDAQAPFNQDSLSGTLNASIIAANTDNGEGIAGIAPNVTLQVIRTMGKCGGRLSDISDALLWVGGVQPELAEDGAEIWNSLDVDIVYLPAGLLVRCPARMQSALDALREQDIIIVTAAGNARVPTSEYAPGGCRGVIAIGATDARGALTPYTNSDVALVAPGGDLSRDDNGDNLPDGIIGAKYTSNCIDPGTGELVNRCDYSLEQGTSQASAVGAGALALLWSHFPEDTPDEITERFLAATIPLDARHCSGPCENFSGGQPLPGTDGICERPCGAGRLDLSLAVP